MITEKKIGTTGRGIGPTYVNKYNRVGIRALDLLYLKKLKQKVDVFFEKTLKQYTFDDSEISKIKEQIKEFMKCSEYISRYISDTFTIIHNQSQ